MLNYSQVTSLCDIFVNIRSESEYHNVSEQRCKMCWTRFIVSNGELHLKISQGGVDAFH